MDYFRLLLALLVVAIHTSPLSSFDGTADFVLTRILARVAVPFFLMVTGYFMLPQHLLHHSKDYRSLAGFLKKTLLLYLVSMALYLPINLYAGHFRNAGIWDILRMVIFDGTFYHLWYLPAVLLGVLIVRLLGRRLPYKAVLLVCLFLYFLGLLGDSYYGLLFMLPGLKSAYDMLFILFSYTRNGIFYAPIFLAMGAGFRNSGHLPENQASRHSSMPAQSGGIWVKSVCFFLFAACMVAEGLMLRHFHMQRHDSMYLILLPCMYFLFSLIASIGRILPPSKYLRTLSAYVYLLHPLFIILVRGSAKAVHLERALIDNSLVHYIAVCLSSICFSALVAGIPYVWLLMGKPKGFSRSRAWIEVSRENLRQNADALRGLLPSQCRLMAAVKTNAYGHGAVMVSKALNQMGVDAFCVASASEGAELRQHGIQGEILVLGYTHRKELPLLKKYHLIQTVVDYEYAQMLNHYGKKIKVHLKIDTGMHRLGERCEELEKICSIFDMKNLVIEGMYTHLCADGATSSDKAFTAAQAEAFHQVAAALKELGCSCPKVHLLASSGLIHNPRLAGDYARCGIALYGYLSRRSDLENCNIPLLPILSVKARISLVKDLHQGEAAGYGMSHIANQDGKIAVLTIGYGDGLPRSLSCGRGKVLINGCDAPIIGRVCMDQTIVDITGIPDVKAGDEAVIIGKSGEKEITAYDLAEEAETITNEILSRLGLRLERIMT